MFKKDDSQQSLIELLRNEVIKKLGWGPVRSWHSSMYDELGKEVFGSSQVLLSVATLKRFFGVVKHHGNPSTNTLDALSAFCGYDNWRAFKARNISNGTKRIRPSLSSKFYLFLVGFIVLFLVVIFVVNKQESVTIDSEKIIFSSRPVTNSFPNSVVFDFDLNGLKSENIVIQQYWDPTKTIHVQDQQKSATGIYYFPGYFLASLKINDEVIKEHDLFLKSDGWLGMLEYDPVPKYFALANSANALSSPPYIINELSSSEKPIISSYHFVDDLGDISGDNFSLQCDLKYVYDDKWAICHSTYVYLLGTTGALIIPFSKAGCISDNNLMLNDLYFDGKENDLSAFSTDFSDYKNIGIINNNKEVVVSIGGNPVYRGGYEKSMGRLVGIRIKFKGAGEVKNLALSNGSGQIALGASL